jgi:O-6-methylguanine DNA methyltransferase
MSGAVEDGGRLHYASFDARLFRGHAVLSERGLCRLELVERLAREPGPALRAWISKRFPRARLERDERALSGLIGQLDEYAAGRRRRFDQALDLRGTPFQQRVWRGLLDIPYGAIASYGTVATRIGAPGAARAVGAANGANPVPILVPCHRVVAGASLGGFGLGLAQKRVLLDLEGVRDYERGA